MSPEERRIQSILTLIKLHSVEPQAREAKVSIGATDLDDCAVVNLSSTIDLCIGSDFVRGEGFLLFQLGLLSRAQIGHYLVGANLSDIAAMGATPVGLVVAARYGPRQSDEQFAEIMEGVVRACSMYGAPLLGGDTGSYELPVLSASAFGVCPPGKALLRRNGKPGDMVYLSGSIGTAGAAFALFSKNKHLASTLPSAVIDELLLPWRQVSPAIEHGKLLVESGYSKLRIPAIVTADSG